MGVDREADGGGLRIFLRSLRVNVVGGTVWAVAITMIQPLQANTSLTPGNILLLLASGAVAGGFFSIGGFLTPKIESKTEKLGMFNTFIYDFVYGLISIYLTIAMTLALAALIIILSGGAFPIKSNGEVLSFLHITDIVNSLSLNYLLEICIMPLAGSSIMAFLRLVKKLI